MDEYEKWVEMEMKCGPFECTMRRVLDKYRAFKAKAEEPLALAEEQSKPVEATAEASLVEENAFNEMGNISNDVYALSPDLGFKLRTQICIARGQMEIKAKRYRPSSPAVEELVEALEKLARLGNGTEYGNSEGNRIAQEALAKYDNAKGGK